MPMNDTNNADRRWENLVVNGIRESSQEHTTKTATNDGVTQGSFLDNGHRLVNRVEEILGSSRGSIEIPFEGGNNFGFRDLANPEPTHLLELLPEIVSDI